VAPRRGVPIVSGGISLTPRDMARFDLLFTPSGRQKVRPVISDAALEKIRKGVRPDVYRADFDEDDGFADSEAARRNSYQWDFVMNDGDFFKGGFAGQGIYISPSPDLVIAFFHTFDKNGNGHELTRVARQPAKSSSFD